MNRAFKSLRRIANPVRMALKGRIGLKAAMMNSTRAAWQPWSKRYTTARVNAKRRWNVFAISGTTGAECDTENFTDRDYVLRAASWRRAVKLWSAPDSNAPACTGPQRAQTPSSPCAARNSVDAAKISGSHAKFKRKRPYEPIPKSDVLPRSSRRSWEGRRHDSHSLRLPPVTAMTQCWV